MAHLPTKAARLVCAIIASTALTTPALADRSEAPRRGHAQQHRQYDRGHRAHDAGVIRIDGRRYRIDDRRSNRQIARAFRNAGYKAWVADGKVFARFERRDRPRIKWRSGKLDARIRYVGDCVVIKLHKCRPHKFERGPKIRTNVISPSRPARRGWARECGW